jgi:hypothetical protein
VKAFGSVPAGPSRRRRLPPNLPDAVAQAHPSHTRDGDGPPLGFRGCAGWGTDGRTDGTERGETARIFTWRKGQQNPPNPMRGPRVRGLGLGGTGTARALSRSAARLPLAWTRGRLPAFASCHVGRVPPTAHVSLPFPACGAGAVPVRFLTVAHCRAGPLPGWVPLAVVQYCSSTAVLEAFCIVFFSL